ncbi:hypothetical protein JW877_10100 [bacterium]|nr:hypothetical protein [bacterium]
MLLFAADSQAISLSLGLKAFPLISAHWNTQPRPQDYSVTTASKTGWGYGAYTNIHLWKIFSLQTEVYFVNKGACHTINHPGMVWGDMNATYTFDYIEVPLSIKSKLYQYRNFMLVSAFGGYWAYLTYANYHFQNDFLGTFENDILEDVRKSDIGFLYSWEISYVYRFIALSFDYTYSMGLVDITMPTGQGFDQVKLRNYVHMFVLNLSFRIVGKNSPG